MPGTVQHIEFQLADLDLISLLQPTIGRDVLCIENAIAPAAFRRMLQEEQIVLLRPLDRYVQACLQIRGAAHMIDVPVGQPDLVYRGAGLRDSALNVWKVA